MDITYGGGSTFRIRGEGTVVVDPAARSEEDGILLFSERRPRSKAIVNGPGEYEIRGTLITTLHAGTSTSRSLTHTVEMGGITVTHLSDPSTPLSERDLRTVGKVDVLLVRADDLPAAQRAVSDMLPRVVIPFGRHAQELCAALGGTPGQPQARFSWNGTTAAPKALILKGPGTRRTAA